MSTKTSWIVVIAIAIVALAIYSFWFAKEKAVEQAGDNNNQSQSPTPTPPGGVTPSSTVKRVRIISPKAGEVWTRGKNYLVRWDTSSVLETEDAFINLIPTSSAITNPYAPKVVGKEMFNSGIYPQGFPPEGAFSYTVPQSLKPGTYQIVVLVGKNCNTDLKIRCIYDTSDGLFTIK